MKITEALLGEHGVFYPQFDYLERAVPTGNSLPEIKAQAALLAAGLASHAHLEDELLFVPLDPHLGEAGPLTVMREEHAEIEASLTRVLEQQHDEIERALARLTETDSPAEARQLVLHAVEVAREHFAKEEQVLFPLAEQFLTSNELNSLGEQWANRRGVSLSF